MKPTATAATTTITTKNSKGTKRGKRTTKTTKSTDITTLTSTTGGIKQTKEFKKDKREGSNNHSIIRAEKNQNKNKKGKINTNNREERDTSPHLEHSSNYDKTKSTRTGLEKEKYISYINNLRNETIGNNNNKDNYFRTHSTPYHTIFSTGCSIYQDWQSYVFFYHAVIQSGQEGHISRIASGCSENNKGDIEQIQKQFTKEIVSMRPRQPNSNSNTSKPRLKAKLQRKLNQSAIFF